MVQIPIRSRFQRNAVIPVRLWRELNSRGISVYFDRARHGGLGSLHDDLLPDVQEQTVSRIAYRLASGRSQG